jgi:hypothetical protein
MTQSTKIFSGVVVLAALGGAIYYAQNKDKQIGTSQTTSADMPDLKVDDVDKISVQSGEKPEITLEKKGDKWEVTKPVQATANQSNADQMVKNLKELKPKEVVAPSPTEDSKKDYDFTPQKQVHVVAFKGGEKKLDLTFGASGARGQTMMVAGKQPIYTVSGYSSYLYTREVKGYRDTEIFKYDDAVANSFVIDKKDGSEFSFTKNGDHWAGTYKGKPIERMDEDRVKDAVRAFKTLTADDFGDGKTAAETGVDEPESKVTIQLKDGAGKYVLRVGKVSTGTNHWAQKDGSDQIYSIASYMADWALAEPSKFQRPADAGAPDSGTPKPSATDHGPNDTKHPR